MDVDLATHIVPLPRVVQTPAGAFSEVFAVEVVLADGRERAEGVVRCIDRAEAQLVANAVEVVRGEVSGSLDALASLPRDGRLTAWRSAWRRWEARSPAGEERLAMSAIDAAVWGLASTSPQESTDAMCRARRQPVYWSGFWLDTPTAGVRTEAHEARSRGFDAVKMRFDAADVRASAERFMAVAQVLPPSMPIAVDAVGSGTAEALAAFVATIDTERLLWIEDPVPSTDLDGFVRLRGARVPIAVGETCWGLRALAEHLDRTSATIPILDLGRLAGPTGLALFLATRGRRYSTVAVHLDATFAAQVLSRLDPVAPTVWLEVMGWWEDPDPAEVRGRLR